MLPALVKIGVQKWSICWLVVSWLTQSFLVSDAADVLRPLCKNGELLCTTQTLSPNSFSAAATSTTLVFYHGGCTEQGLGGMDCQRYAAANQLFVLDTVTSSWRINALLDASSGDQLVASLSIQPRFGHAMISWDESQLVMLGGRSAVDSDHTASVWAEDVWVIYLNNMTAATGSKVHFHMDGAHAPVRTFGAVAARWQQQDALVLAGAQYNDSTATYGPLRIFRFQMQTQQWLPVIEASTPDQSALPEAHPPSPAMIQYNLTAVVYWQGGLYLARPFTQQTLQIHPLQLRDREAGTQTVLQGARPASGAYHALDITNGTLWLYLYTRVLTYDPGYVLPGALADAAVLAMHSMSGFAAWVDAGARPAQMPWLDRQHVFVGGTGQSADLAAADFPPEVYTAGQPLPLPPSHKLHVLPTDVSACGSTSLAVAPVGRRLVVIACVPTAPQYVVVGEPMTVREYPLASSPGRNFGRVEEVQAFHRDYYPTGFDYYIVGLAVRYASGTLVDTVAEGLAGPSAKLLSSSESFVAMQTVGTEEGFIVDIILHTSTGRVLSLKASTLTSWEGRAQLLIKRTDAPARGCDLWLLDSYSEGLQGDTEPALTALLPIWLCPNSTSVSGAAAAAATTSLSVAKLEDAPDGPVVASLLQVSRWEAVQQVLQLPAGSGLLVLQLPRTDDNALALLPLRDRGTELVQEVLVDTLSGTAYRAGFDRGLFQKFDSELHRNESWVSTSVGLGSHQVLLQRRCLSSLSGITVCTWVLDVWRNDSSWQHAVLRTADVPAGGQAAEAAAQLIPIEPPRVLLWRGSFHTMATLEVSEASATAPAPVSLLGCTCQPWNSTVFEVAADNVPIGCQSWNSLLRYMEEGILYNLPIDWQPPNVDGWFCPVLEGCPTQRQNGYDDCDAVYAVSAAGCICDSGMCGTDDDPGTCTVSPSTCAYGTPSGTYDVDLKSARDACPAAPASPAAPSEYFVTANAYPSVAVIPSTGVSPVMWGFVYIPPTDVKGLWDNATEGVVVAHPTYGAATGDRLLVLDVATMWWAAARVIPSDPASTRSRGAMAYHQGRLFLFGGCGGADGSEVQLNDLLMVDLYTPLSIRRWVTIDIAPSLINLPDMGASTCKGQLSYSSGSLTADDFSTRPQQPQLGVLDRPSLMALQLNSQLFLTPLPQRTVVSTEVALHRALRHALDGDRVRVTADVTLNITHVYVRAAVALEGGPAPRFQDHTPRPSGDSSSQQASTGAARSLVAFDDTTDDCGDYCLYEYEDEQPSDALPAVPDHTNPLPADIRWLTCSPTNDVGIIVRARTATLHGLGVRNCSYAIYVEQLWGDAVDATTADSATTGAVPGSPIALSSMAVANNTGYGLFFNRGLMQLSDVHFHNNTFDGGQNNSLAVLATGWETCLLNVTSCSFINNTGGAVRLGSERGFMAAALGKSADTCTSTFEASLFLNNTRDGEGAAIYFPYLSHPLLLSRSVFERNQGSDGGAVFVGNSSDCDSSHSLTISGCSFSMNAAVGLSSGSNSGTTDRGQGDGGALLATGYGPKHLVQILDSDFRANVARRRGGAMWAQLGFADEAERVFDRDNLAKAPEVVRFATSVTLSAAAEPGAAELQVANCSFSANAAGSASVAEVNPETGAGGAVYLSIGAVAMSFVSTNFTGNQAAGSGGGVAVYGPATLLSLQQVRFQDCIAQYQGGGLLVHGNLLGTISAMGLSFSADSRLDLVGCTFLNNTAGAYNQGAPGNSTALRRLRATDVMTALPAGGGGMLANFSGSVGLSDSLFEGNTAAAGSGGGLLSFTPSVTTTVVSSTRFVGNYAEDNGGGMACDMCGDLQLFGCRFEGNRAGAGGGAWVSGALGLLLDNSTFLLNDASAGMHGSRNISSDCAEGAGGALCLDGGLGAAAIQESRFSNNTAEVGGGIFLGGVCTAAQPRCVTLSGASAAPTLDGNHARLGSGHQAFFGLLSTMLVACPNANATPVNATAEELRLCVPSVAGDAQLSSGAVRLELPELGNQTLSASSNAEFQIAVHLVDAFGNVVPEVLQDASLRVSVELVNSTAATVRGASAVAAHGQANFTALQLLADPGEQYELYFRPEQGYHPVAGDSVLISLRRCTLGQALQHQVCDNCTASTFLFNPENNTCRSCPKNADCLSGLVIPQDNWWQSSPYSDQMHPCLNRQSCVYKQGRGQGVTASRKDALWAWHDEHSRLLNSADDVTAQEVEEYVQMQCHIGYTGTLCASCDNGYGSRAGRCVRCFNHGLAVFVLCLLVGGQALFLMYTTYLHFATETGLWARLWASAAAKVASASHGAQLRPPGLQEAQDGFTDLGSLETGGPAEAAPSSLELDSRAPLTASVAAEAAAAKDAKPPGISITITATPAEAFIPCEDAGACMKAAAAAPPANDATAQGPVVPSSKSAADTAIVPGPSSAAAEADDDEPDGPRPTPGTTTWNVHRALPPPLTLSLGPPSRGTSPSRLRPPSAVLDGGLAVDLASPGSPGELGVNSPSRLRPPCTILDSALPTGLASPGSSGGRGISHSSWNAAFSITTPTGERAPSVRFLDRLAWPLSLHTGSRTLPGRAPAPSPPSETQLGAAAGGQRFHSYTSRAPPTPSATPHPRALPRSYTGHSHAAWDAPGVVAEMVEQISEQMGEGGEVPGLARSQGRRLNNEEIAELVEDAEEEQGRLEALVSILKAFISYLQVLGSLSQLRVAMGDSLLRFLALLHSSNPDSWTPLECSFTGSNVQQTVGVILLTVLQPVVLGIAALVFWGVMFLCYRGAGDRRMTPTQLLDRVLMTIVQIAFFYYESITSTVMTMFACITLDRSPTLEEVTEVGVRRLQIGEYWYDNPNLRCNVGVHQALKWIVAVPYLITFSLGLPLVSGLVLFAKHQQQMAHRRRVLARSASHKAQHSTFAGSSFDGSEGTDASGEGPRGLQEPRTRLVLGFMYLDYAERFCWWESVISLRKFLIITIVVAMRGGSQSLQVLLGQIVLALALLAHHAVSPFTEDILNSIERWSLFAVLGTLTVMGLYTSDRPTASLQLLGSIVAILINVAMMLYLLYHIVLLVSSRGTRKQLLGSVLALSKLLGLPHDRIRAMYKHSTVLATRLKHRMSAKRARRSVDLSDDKDSPERNSFEAEDDDRDGSRDPKGHGRGEGGASRRGMMQWPPPAWVQMRRAAEARRAAAAAAAAAAVDGHTATTGYADQPGLALKHEQGVA